MGATWGSTRVGQEAGREGILWARAFTVVSAGRNGGDRISRFRVG